MSDRHARQPDPDNDREELRRIPGSRRLGRGEGLLLERTLSLFIDRFEAAGRRKPIGCEGDITDTGNALARAVAAAVPSIATRPRHAMT